MEKPISPRSFNQQYNREDVSMSNLFEKETDNELKEILNESSRPREFIPAQELYFDAKVQPMPDMVKVMGYEVIEGQRYKVIQI